MIRRASLAFVALAMTIPDGVALEWRPGMDPATLGGSFLQTCRDCRVDASGRLTCTCSRENGVPRSTFLLLSTCGPGAAIHNRYGSLACQPILAGSYVKTCKEFLASGDRIGAYCKNRDGFHIAATSPRVADCPHLAFSNIDGKIVCEAATDARPADDAKPSAKAKAAAPVGKVGKGLASPGGIAKQERIGAPPDVPIVPASMAYAPPLAASGLRLHACQTLKGKWCGKSAADQFCTTQGYVQAQTFDTGKERTKAQTFNGKVCDDEKCRVFVRIVCVR